jgi:CubicO group peptidase (beta-lactamase class C family)
MRCNVSVKNVGVGAARVVGFLSLFMAAGRVAAEALPETAAGRQMAAWLAAVNSGDKERMRAFEAANGPGVAADPSRVERLVRRDEALWKDSGGFEVEKVLGSDEGKIAVAVRQKELGYWMQFGMGVAAEAPHGVTGFGFRGMEMPAELLPKEVLPEKEIAARTEALIDALVKRDQFSGVILVAQGERVIYQRAAGLADVERQAPNRMDTKLNIASMGKMFTAVAVGQLVEAGKLRYEETLAEALPKYPDRELAGKVTIAQLLSHTSGIENPGYASKKAMVALFARGLRRVGEYVPTEKVDKLAFEPGTKYAYSNYGFVLLGAVIEEASGEDFYAYLRGHVYAPAGMTDTDAAEVGNGMANLAMGYMDMPGGGRKVNTPVVPARGLPAGLGYSTGLDMARFAEALRGGKLLKAATLEELWKPREDTGVGRMYGYGFHVTRYNGQRIVGHTGGWDGITCAFDMYPELGYSVVILNNIDSAPSPVTFKLREWLTQGR